MKHRAIVFGLSAAAFVLTGAVVFEGGPDPVIYPPQDVPIFFTHDYHTRKPENGLDGEGLSCVFCHENTATSTHAAQRDIPGHGTCESCHEDWIGSEKQPAPAELCAKCHTDPALTRGPGARAKLHIPEPHIKFAHKTHVDANVACVECHANVSKKKVATRDDFPTMDRCVGCHEKMGAKTECDTCHFTLPSGRLQTTFPEGQLEPRRLHQFAIHDAEFLRDHAAASKRDRAYCASCHTDSFCLQCHDGVARDVRYHPGDWISQHFIRAKKDDFRCQSCHRLQTFCIDCHVRSGVASVNPGATVAALPNENTRRTIRQNESGVALGPHPMAADGWLSRGSKNFHGVFAQQNMRSCASCHQEQFCITCHSASPRTTAPTVGGNPHGPNPGRLRGSTARLRNARMCLKCHSPYDASWR